MADGQRRYAEPSGEGCVRVPVELGVVVGVEVDRAGGHDATAGVESLCAARADAAADHGDPAVFDANVGPEPGNAGAVHHGPATDHNIKFRYLYLSFLLKVISRHSLDIEVDIPDGTPERVVRVVTDNSRTLKFDDSGFESE